LACSAGRRHADGPGLFAQPRAQPTIRYLGYAQAAPDPVIMQSRPTATPVDSAAYPPPQYGEGVLALISWLRGETTAQPAGDNGLSPYVVRRPPVNPA
jgi:hypothetical protein